MYIFLFFAVMNTSIVFRIKTLYWCIVLGCAVSLSAQAQPLLQHPAHPTRILVKIKAESALLNEIEMLKHRSIAQKSQANQNEAEVVNLTLVDNGAMPMLTAAYTSGIESVQQLCPNIDKSNKEALKCGLDRIFVAEMRSGYEVQAFLQTLSTQNSSLKALVQSFDYAEPDYIGYGAGENAHSEFTINLEEPPRNDNGKKGASLQALTPNDPYFTQQWGMQNTGQNIGGKIGKTGADANLSAAWSITQGTDSVIVAILDSGQPVGAAAMPDFAGRLMAGYDYAYNDADPTDDHGHGSNVMSIATAKGNNGVGIAGVNWNCKILPVKILNSSNSGQYSWWVNGIRFAADKGAKVLNMSVGGSGRSSALEDAIVYAYSKGAIVVACMMNTNSNDTYYPAAYSQSIAVGAINNQGARAVPFCFSPTSGSNYGVNLLVVAPGEQIAGYRNTDGAVTNWCGTSQATPIVSGIVSLMLGVQPTLTFDEVHTILKNTAIDGVGSASEDGPGWDMYYGWGRVNAAAAVQAAKALRDMSMVQETNGTEPIVETIYPNPTSDDATFTLTLPTASNVRLTIYTLLGAALETVVDNMLPAGQHQLVWQSIGLPSGVYGYRLEAGSKVRSGLVNVVR